MRAKGIKQIIAPALVSMALGVGELYAAAYMKILIEKLFVD
jgi:hypothetical protein